MLGGAKCYGKRESKQIEGDPECGEYGFKHGSQVALIEDLQLAKEGLSYADVRGGAHSRQKEQPVPRP